MPLFLLETNDGAIRQVLRAKCLSCARSVAANAAGLEGPMVWRDPDLSTVKPIQPDAGVSGVVLRLDNLFKAE